MKTNHDDSQELLQHVDERRRSFLGKLLAGGAGGGKGKGGGAGGGKGKGGRG